jgi:hypothetical protein
MLNTLSSISFHSSMVRGKNESEVQARRLSRGHFAVSDHVDYLQTYKIKSVVICKDTNIKTLARISLDY